MSLLLEETPQWKIEKGLQYLADVELISLLIGGNPDKANEKARSILGVTSLKQIGRLSMNDLTRLGLTKQESGRVISAIELGRRRDLSDLQERVRIQSSRDAFNVIGAALKDLLIEEFYAFKMISEKDEITENSVVNIMRVKSTISNHYQLLWVKKAEMADTGIPYMIFVDGLMIGLVVLMPGIQFTHDMAVILSDQATTTSRYKRLSKLILYIVCTREMLDRFNEDTMWEHNRFTTRVFTNDSVSMKYRSLFELKERRDDASGNYSNILIYQNADKILPPLRRG